MFALLAAIAFGLALILDLAGASLGTIDVQTLLLVGLLFVALHLAGFGTGWDWRSSYRRRRR